jgi:DNA adenine methylase
VEQVSTIEVTLEQWHRFRATAPSGRRDRALRALFFNRTNYSGIINRRAGPIGGQKQESAYKIDCRFPRATLIRRIQQVASLKDRIAFVWNCSWRAGIARLTHQCRRGEGGLRERDVFYYLDPPFFHKAERLYTYFFTARDHWRLRATVDRLGSPWILSYDAGEKVDTFYGRGQRTAEIQSQYTTARAAASRQIKTEAIIARAGMILPQDIDMRYRETRKATLLWNVVALPPMGSEGSTDDSCPARQGRSIPVGTAIAEAVGDETMS